MAVWAADDFLAQVKSRAQLPDITGALSNEDILLLADQAMQTEIEPLVLGLKREYWTKVYDEDIVPGTTEYRIFHRAAGAKLRDLLLVDSAGNEYSIPEIAPEQAWRYKQYQANWITSSAYYVQGEHVVLVPAPTQSGYVLRQKYYLRRPRLTIDTDNYAVITGVTGPILSVAATPANITTGSYVDIVRNKPYFDIVTVEAEVALSGVGSIALAETPSSSVRVGDYVCVADTSYLIPLPVEIQQLLLTATVGKVLMALGDERATREIGVFERDRERVKVLLSPRNEGEAPRVINRSSPIRGGFWRPR